jgi:hypothetical protein
MQQIDILYPAFVQVLLTFVVYGLHAVARARAVSRLDRGRGNPELALDRLVWPEDAEKRAANQRNPFELPVLFYAVVAFALLTKEVDSLMPGRAWLWLAWLFVVTRMVHATIHVGPNKVRWRSPAFALDLLVLAGMWLKLYLHVLSGTLA